MGEEALVYSRRALDESLLEIVARPNSAVQVAQLSTTAILTSQIELSLEDHRAAQEVLESILQAALSDDELLQAAGLASECIAAADEDSELDDQEAEGLTSNSVALALAFLDRLQDPSLLESEEALGGSGFKALRARPEFGEWRSAR
jgi:hypothetical protein